MQATVPRRIETPSGPWSERDRRLRPVMSTVSTSWSLPISIDVHGNGLPEAARTRSPPRTASIRSTARKYAAVLLFVQVLMTAGLMIAGIYTTRRFARRRIQIEASAQRARERLELATLNSNDGIWDWHIQSKQVFWTPRIPMCVHGPMMSRAVDWLRAAIAA